jgi:transcription initiation factor IIE alpha subunit
MDGTRLTDDDVYRFILAQIESVPHLEALLLLWRSRPRGWTDDQLAAELFVDVSVVRSLLKELLRQNLVSMTEPGEYRYDPKSADMDVLVAAVADTYKRELIRVSSLIHSKAASAARDFARAFRFTKDKD